MLRAARALHRRLVTDERGSLALTMTVLLIVANLSTLVLTRTFVTMHQVRISQDFAASLADADGAMADALFQIDQVANPPSNITGTGTIANKGTYKYRATKLDADTYDVVAKGVINGSTHAIHATVERNELFPYVIFSNQAVTFNGNGAGNIYSYNSSGDITHQARVGSNHAITVSSGSGAGDFQDFYTPAGSCSGCANPVAKRGPYVTPTYPLPTTYQPCPLGGIFTGTVNGGNGTPYLCNVDVTLQGIVNTSSTPVIIYITADHKLTMTGANINFNGQSTCTSANFRIYKYGTGAIVNGSGANAADYCGILYAPQSLLTINGGEHFYGSLTLNQLQVNGNPNYTLAYDGQVSALLAQNWHVTHWREVPSSSVNL